MQNLKSKAQGLGSVCWWSLKLKGSIMPEAGAAAGESMWADEQAERSRSRSSQRRAETVNQVERDAQTDRHTDRLGP